MCSCPCGHEATGVLVVLCDRVGHLVRAKNYNGTWVFVHSRQYAGRLRMPAKVFHLLVVVSEVASAVINPERHTKMRLLALPSRFLWDFIQS